MKRAMNGQGRTMVDCVVVGAGPAGLAASAALAERGVEHVVLDRGRAGESWHTQRWDSFRLNTPGWMNQLLGEQARDAFLTGAEVVQRFERLAADHPVRSGVQVERLSPAGDGYALLTGDGELRARTVVVATGDQNVPLVPALARTLPDRVAQYHTADYHRPGALPAGGVLVVGSAQSGCQIAEGLLAAGASSWRPAPPVACPGGTGAATASSGWSRPGSSTSGRRTCPTRPSCAPRSRSSRRAAAA
jgi:putative flavoprotein involved in K+ transport